MTDAAPRLLTVAEACERLAVSRRLLRDHVKGGKLPFYH